MPSYPDASSTFLEENPWRLTQLPAPHTQISRASRSAQQCSVLAVHRQHKLRVLSLPHSLMAQAEAFREMPTACYPVPPYRCVGKRQGGSKREARRCDEQGVWEAGLAGFEPATHGPGNRCCYSPIPEKAYFYAVSDPSLLHDSTTIDCHKLSDRLSVCPCSRSSTLDLGSSVLPR